eukprot:TRINITY_DN15695_c0_g1_i1.p1 TRINITY_DN15695_c0_g1~~TRINITY_DN15695_c0_g1_i1.p1  ORF type:complete len:407 (-),score=117.05 TRINITY_DN15695_c0_g1_i1:107-1204(-)
MEEVIMAVVQRAVLPLAGRLSALELELRGLRAAFEEGRPLAQAASAPSAPRSVSSAAADAATGAAAAVAAAAGTLASGEAPGVCGGDASAGGASGSAPTTRREARPAPEDSGAERSSPSAMLRRLQQAAAAAQGDGGSPSAIRASREGVVSSCGSEATTAATPPSTLSGTCGGAMASRSGVQSAGTGTAAIFFDFDSTLATPRYLERAKDYAFADRLALCGSLSRQEILANFGGAARVARLHALLQRLRARRVALFVVSLGITEAMRRQLEIVGLGRFFPTGRVYGQDSPELSQASYRRDEVVAQLVREQGWASDRVLLVDRDAGVLESCAAAGVCQTLRVHGEGISLDEMERVEALALAWASSE